MLIPLVLQDFVLICTSAGRLNHVLDVRVLIKPHPNHAAVPAIKKGSEVLTQPDLDVLPELLHVLPGIETSLSQGIQSGVKEAVYSIMDAFGFERDKRFLSQHCIHTLLPARMLDIASGQQNVM